MHFSWVYLVCWWCVHIIWSPGWAWLLIWNRSIGNTTIDNMYWSGDSVCFCFALIGHSCFSYSTAIVVMVGVIISGHSLNYFQIRHVWATIWNNLDGVIKEHRSVMAYVQTTGCHHECHQLDYHIYPWDAREPMSFRSSFRTWIMSNWWELPKNFHRQRYEWTWAYKLHAIWFRKSDFWRLAISLRPSYLCREKNAFVSPGRNCKTRGLWH